MSYKLSICIPTHNRCESLKETLKSIFDQELSDDIQVVVLDSASTDKTKQIVNSFKKNNIKYIFNDKKQGIDLDMSLTVDNADGKFCWLVSDDDPITPNSIEILFKNIEQNHDIYLCNRIVCDKDLNPIKNKDWLLDNGVNLYDLSNEKSLEEYLDNCLEFGAIFSYMCAIAFKRSEWMKTKYDNNFTNTGYGHVTRIFDIIKNGGKLKYIKEPMLFNRSFNDSFLYMGIKNRFMLDINGYMKLSERCLSNYSFAIKKKFLRVMILEHPWYQLIKLKAHVDDDSEWKEIKYKLIYCGYTKFQIKLSEILAFNKELVLFLIKLRFLYNTSSIHRFKYLFINKINLNK